MWIAMNERYRQEKERYALKESCEDCRHFFEEGARCAMLYPVEPHRRETFARAQDGERIYFCKMFEVEDA